MPLALIGVVAAVFLGGVVRLLDWRRYEAPLELWIGPHTLELRRVYRDRLLHRERLDLSGLIACEPVPHGLRLVSKGAPDRWLIAGYRSTAELGWVAGHLGERIAALAGGEPDPRLVGLRVRA